MKHIHIVSGTYYHQAMKAGYVYTIVGGGAKDPAGVPSASASLISDASRCRVFVLANSSGVYYGQKMTAGRLYPVAGTGTRGFSGDGGPALAAALDYPQGVAVDRNGNVLLSDSEAAAETRIRVVAASTGTFYGQPMTAGDIYTVAGTGTPGTRATAARPPRRRSIPSASRPTSAATWSSPTAAGSAWWRRGPAPSTAGP